MSNARTDPDIPKLSKSICGVRKICDLRKKKLKKKLRMRLFFITGNSMFPYRPRYSDRVGNKIVFRA